MKKLVAIAVIGLAFGLAQAQNVTKKDFAAVCPLDLPGVSAKATPTATGVDVVFATTVKSAIPDLQGRIGLLSDLLNRAVAQPAGGAQRAGVKFSAKGEATPDGGRLLLTPVDKADLEKLQTNVAGKVGAMNAEKTCYVLANVN
jgi:hypothetical protein